MNPNPGAGRCGKWKGQQRFAVPARAERTEQIVPDFTRHRVAVWTEPRPGSGPELFRIFALGDQLPDALHHLRPVFAVGHAKPGIARAQYLDSGLTGVD